MRLGKATKPISRVSWEKLCYPKEEGGLAIKDIRKFNMALLARNGGCCLKKEESGKRYWSSNMVWNQVRINYV